MNQMPNVPISTETSVMPAVSACLCHRCGKRHGRLGIETLLQPLDLRRLMAADDGSLEIVEDLERESFRPQAQLSLPAMSLSDSYLRAASTRGSTPAGATPVPVDGSEDDSDGKVPVAVDEPTPTPSPEEEVEAPTPASPNAIVVAPGEDVYAAAAEALSKGVGLHLSSGIHRLTRPLDVEGVLEISGDGQTKTILTTDNQAAWNAEHGDAALIRVTVQFNDHTGMTLRDLSVESGNVGLGTTDKGLHWSNVRNVRFRHLNVAVDTGGVGNTFERVVFQSNGTHVRITGDNVATRFDRCNFINASGEWALEFDQARQLTFEGCVFELNQTTLGTVRLSGSRQVTFRDSWFEANGIAGGSDPDAAEVRTTLHPVHGGMYGLVFESSYFDPIELARRPQLVRADTVTGVSFRDTNGNFRGARYVTGTDSVEITGVVPPIGAVEP